MLKPVKIDKNLTKLLNKQKQEFERKALLLVKDNTYEPDDSLPSCIIVDIDGTLAIRSDRNWLDFNKSNEDLVCAQIKYLTNLTYKDNQIEVIIITGREENWREVTKNWLFHNKVLYKELFMRREGDHRPDFIIKQEIFDKEIRDKYKVFFAIEDLQQVKKMWNGLGIFTLDCSQK